MAEAAEALAALAQAATASPRVARAIGDWRAVIQLELDGEPSALHAVVAAGRFELRAGRHPRPTLVLSGSAAGVARAARGEIDLTHLLADGTVDYRGDYYDLINLSRVAAARGRG
jgi:hypothetical protein